EHWMDTGMEVKAGERVIISATGKLRYLDAPDENGPEGRARGFKDLLRALPVNDAGRGALVARIGEADIAQPFVVRARRDFTARVTGQLALGINQAAKDSATGTYLVRVEIYPLAPGETPAGLVVVRDVARIAGVDARFFAKIPRRVADKQGDPGDMVNFIIIGSETGMQQAFQLAGWVRVDRTKKEAILHGLLASLSKEAYVQMPMSELYLFGRPQDYGFAHAVPLEVVRERHHLRLWKTDFTVNGQPVWCGAATHDIGLERDNRNGRLTHKIDPDIDLEREYVSKTLGETGVVAQRTYFLPADPVLESHTATGGSFHSNGKVLALLLGQNGRDLSASLASLPAKH
ncbi:MAG TPA: LssY C-terminal domain-containing protein, partial [Methylomirabilota bacterium]|nr:LssY C-terminal domain-containing protein [Methylomirabilota bacterium]